MHRLEICGGTHVTDLRAAIVHGVDHVGAGVDDQHFRVNPVFFEKTFLGPNEHRQMAEIVTDNHVKPG
jgi:hypothetical protein